MERGRGREREGGREGKGQWEGKKTELLSFMPIPFSFPDLPDLPLSLSLEGKRERGCDRHTDRQEREEEKESGTDGPMDRQASGGQRR